MTNVSHNLAAGIVTLKGKGKAQRETAYASLSALAYLDSQSRNELIAACRVALGSNPSEIETAALKQQVRIGRIASRLPAAERPKDCADVPALLQWVATQLSSYAAHDAKTVKPGQLGRRSEAFDKCAAASREYLSQIMADVGTGNAKTQKEKNDAKATRATNANPVRGDGKGKAAPTSAEIAAKPAAPTNGDDYVQHMQTQMASLSGYDQKYAKARPMEYSAFADALMHLRTLGNDAANAYQLRKTTEASDAEGNKLAKAPRAKK